jgi:hypothetical protein
MFSWTLGIYDPDLFATREDTERQSDKAFNPLISPTNLTVMGDHRFPDGISSIDLILIKDFLRPCTFTSSFQVLDGIFEKGISMGRFTQGTI